MDLGAGLLRVADGRAGQTGRHGPRELVRQPETPRTARHPRPAPARHPPGTKSRNESSSKSGGSDMSGRIKSGRSGEGGSSRLWQAKMDTCACGESGSKVVVPGGREEEED